jgi:hypothetical protein
MSNLQVGAAASRDWVVHIHLAIGQDAAANASWNWGGAGNSHSDHSSHSEDNGGETHDAEWSFSELSELGKWVRTSESC